MDPADWDAAERAEQFRLGWFANPIFGDGGYPEVMRTRIDARSRAQNLSESRLPKFTDTDKKIIKGMKNQLYIVYSMHVSVWLINNVQTVNNAPAFYRA